MTTASLPIERLAQYRLEERLGAGAMGTVYAAFDEEEKRRVALKVVHPHLLDRKGFLRRFEREAELGERVDHPNVVRTLDADFQVVGGEPWHFLVMEYVEGQTLRALLEEYGHVPEVLVREVGRQIASGLAAIHDAGIVHRDVKPENVLITTDRRVRIMDLGVAKPLDSDLSITQDGQFAGSLLYAAPEQLRARDVGPAADLYALGMVLFELATGSHAVQHEDRPPSVGDLLVATPRPPSTVLPELTPLFDEVTLELLAADPASRGGSAAELAAILAEGEDGAWWSERREAPRHAGLGTRGQRRTSHETALHGREGDVAALKARYEEARGGEGRVVLLEGEAGIGKSRLLDELEDALRAMGDEVLVLSGTSASGGETSAGMAGALREHLVGVDAAELLRDTPLLVPAFDAVLRGEAPPDGAHPLTKDVLITCFAYAIRNLAADRPLVLLLEDLHLADDTGREAFLALARAVPGHPILLVGTSRPELPASWRAELSRLDHASLEGLSRLTKDEVESLLADLLGSRFAASDLSPLIAEKSDGVPLFVLAVLEELKAAGVVVRGQEGAWVTTRPVGEVPVPDSVATLIQARVAELDEGDRKLLDLASCCGFDFDPGLISDVLEQGLLPTLQSIARIQREHGLLRTRGRRIAFDHHLIREVLYEALPSQLRQEYHAAVASALARRSGIKSAEEETPDGHLCVELCTHYLRGAKGEQALPYVDAAIDHLVHSYANVQAIELADLALSAADLLGGTARAEVLHRKAMCLDELGRRDAEEAALREAAGLAQASDQQAMVAEVERATGLMLNKLGRYEEAREHLECSLEIWREIGHRRGEGIVTGNLGMVFRALGRYEEARDHYKRSMEIACEIGDRWHEGVATGNLGCVFLNLGRFEEAREHYERSLEIAREVGNRRHEGGSTGNLGTLFLALGRYGEAREHFERCLVFARETGDRRAEGRSLGNLGSVLVDLGRHEEAREHWEHCLEIACEIGDRQTEAGVTGNLGTLLHTLGRYGDAKAHYERSLAILRDLGHRRGEAIFTGHLASAFRSLGRLVEAREHNERYLAMARDIGYRVGEGFVLYDLAFLAQEEDQDSLALELASQALALRREIGGGSSVAISLTQFAALHWRTGNLGVAREALDEAVDLFRKQHRKEKLAQALALLANLPEGDPSAAEAALQDAGDAGNTRETRFHLWKATGKHEHLAEAKRLLDYRVEHAPEEYRESMLTNVRLNREIESAWKALHPE